MGGHSLVLTYHTTGGAGGGGRGNVNFLWRLFCFSSSIFVALFILCTIGVLTLSPHGLVVKALCY
jgi:hypothetical protein